MTTGSDMDGMMVTATFTDGVESLAWADIAAGSGGVFGTAWSLTQSGDTFGGAWTFSHSRGSLLSLAFDSAPRTVFDVTLPDPGTPGSFRGIDWTSALGTSLPIDVFYSDAVAIGASAPVGDIYRSMLVLFGGGGFTGGTFDFIQDTDNATLDLRPIPLPTGAALASAGLLALGLRRRR